MSLRTTQPMLRAGLMPKRTRQVMSAHTTEERRQERKKVGRLRHQIVSQGTEHRYKEAFAEFRDYHCLPVSFTMPTFEEFDDQVGEYIEDLWDRGAPKSLANYTLAAIQFYRPQAKGHLPWSWRLVKAWNQVEIPLRAAPMSAELLIAYCGVALRWGQACFAHLIQVGFSTFLRTGELLALHPHDVTMGDTGAVIFIKESKGAKQNFLPLERVEVEDRTALQALRFLLETTGPRQPLWPSSRDAFMRLWHAVTDHLGLRNQNFKPYSLRRGGATSAYRSGVTLDALLTKGRWRSTSTARIYLDSGLQAQLQMTLPPDTQRRLRRATADFVQLSQVGARGGGRRRT